MDEWYAKTTSNGVMFRVQGQYGGTARAIEQNARSAQYLNSGDAFSVITPNFEAGYIWSGFGASEEEEKLADKVFNAVQRPAAVTTVQEEEESEDFWASVGGKAEYSRCKDLAMPPDFEPRLFQVSNTSGYMWMQELPAYQQEDLHNHDCFVLDAWNTVFIWIGALCDKAERRNVGKKAESYLKEVTDGRKFEDVLIENVEPGREPPSFQSQFIQWEPELAEKWLHEDPKYQAKVAAAEEAKTEAAKTPFDGYLDPKTNKFDYETLKSSFPKGVKPDAKEYYLSDDEFKTVFGMDMNEFLQNTFPKRVRMKKEHGLY